MKLEDFVIVYEKTHEDVREEAMRRISEIAKKRVKQSGHKV